MGYFRAIDLIIFGSGVLVTFFLILLLQNEMQRVEISVIALLPVLVTGFLVIPIPNQHNILVFLTNMYNYYFVNNQKFYWKGWCNEYGESESEDKQ